MQIYINPSQPRRDMKFWFRTHISHIDSPVDVMHPLNIEAQIYLYRWARSADYASGVAIGDLHSYLFHRTSVSKKRMGDTIVQSTLYNPRVLKGVAKNNPEKPRMLYVFHNKYDLIYGLEWQICLWLYKLESPRPTLEDMEQYLEELWSMPLGELEEVYIKPTKNFIHKIDWQDVWKRNLLFDQTEAHEERLRDLRIQTVPTPTAPKTLIS